MCAARTRLAILAGSLGLAVACTPSERGVPEEVIRHNILGGARLGQTKWADAEAEFRKASELRPHDPLLLTNLAIALIQQEGKEAEAQALLERVAAEDPEYAPAHFNLGLLVARQGDFERAVPHFSKAAELVPDELYTRYYLGTSLARTGHEPEGIDALRDALERDPTHVSTLYALGRLLLQQGQSEEGVALINRSQEIRARSGLDEAIGMEYGEQGPLSRAADYPGNALEAPEPVPLRFEARERVELGPAAFRRLPSTLVPTEHGAGLLVSDGSIIAQVFPAGSPGPLAHAPVDQAKIVGLAAGDLDRDGPVDLALLLIDETPSGARLLPAWLRRVESGRFSNPAPTEGTFSGPAEVVLGSPEFGADLVLVDRDHDGDLDLFWCWAAGAGGAGCKLATNDGGGRFAVADSGAHGFEFRPGATGPVTVALSDVDNDRDVDLLAAGPSGVRLYTNLRDGRFDDISDAAGLGAIPGPVGALVPSDLDKDGWMDLLVAGAGGVQLALNRGGRFAPPVALDPETSRSAAIAAVVFDADNDGFLDVVTASAEKVTALHNRGAGHFEVWSGLLAGAAAGARPLAPLDVDRDGDLDLVLAEAQGATRLLTNEGGNANHWIDLDSHGVSDNRFGIGAKVELLSGALRQKFEITHPVPLHAGLGRRERVDAVRYLWPSGVLQDEIDLEAGAVRTVTELDRKGTSCPLLYAWVNGDWHFVTDFLGGAAVGYQVRPGVFNVPDTDEYVRIEGGLSEGPDRRFRLRLNNQLEEVIWFDAAELVVVDHPEGTEVYPNERLVAGPPWPEFALYAAADIRPIVSARAVEDGTDLTAELERRDRVFAGPSRRLRPKGYAERHTFELDLGAFARDERVVLLLDGWIDYADSSSNVAAAQAGLTLLPPRLSVADGRGGWRDASSRMGFPAGLPKTVTVDLTGLFASTDHRLRIETTMCIYWDRARIMRGGERTPLAARRLAPERAVLRFGGFPRPTSPDGRAPLGYAPQQVDAEATWKAHVGAYTGFGEVTPLLLSIDDRFVTTRSGDEIELVFPAAGAPPPGFTRTFLLFADGFGKDMDPNSAASDAVEPMPFHGMPSYPYGTAIAPPAWQHDLGAAPRTVAPSAAGWPGAPPLGRHAGS